MSEIFPKGTKVKIGIGYTQSLATMDKVFEVLEWRSKGNWDMYVVRDGNGVTYEFMDHLLEETDEPLVVGATLFELLYAPFGTKAFSPANDTVLRREENGWVTTVRLRKPLSDDELKSYLPAYLVGSFL